jgi:hypothetical protein
MKFDPVGWLRAFCEWCAGQWAELKAWLGPTAESAFGKITLEELIRVAILALSSGGLTAFLQAIAAGSSAIFEDPATAKEVTLVVTFVTAVFDLVRRLRHDASTLAKPMITPSKGGEP